MTPREISLLKCSVHKSLPMAEQAVTLFCERLLELDPTLRELFDNDLEDQGSKLWQILGLAACGSVRLDSLASAARRLGLDHARYHVKERHYDTVSEALLWTLAKGLGTDFTPETKIAWGKSYWMLAEIMRAGARDGAAKLRRAAA